MGALRVETGTCAGELPASRECRMSVRPVRRTVAALVGGASAALLLVAFAPGSATTVAANVTGPLPAGSALHGEREELKALPPADIADLDTVGDQLKYAKQAA